MHSLRQVWATSAALLGAAAVAVVAALSPLGSPVVWAGATATVVLAIAGLRTADRGTLLVGQTVPLTIGVATLTVTSAGVSTDGSGSWQLVVAIAGYPFLARAVIRLVTAHREVRAGDVVVASALLGTAVGLLVHVAMEGWRVDAGASLWHHARLALPAVLVALDVALVAVAGRGMRSPAARRGPLGVVLVGLTCLAGAHGWQQVTATPAGAVAAGTTEALAVVGLLAVGLAVLHPAASIEPVRMLERNVPFSVLHAASISTALLAAPAVVAVQAARGSAASATVAVGAVLAGTILAVHQVGLLRARAATEHQATHDALTGLPNRTLVVDRLDRSIAHARRTSGSCAVLFMDLDRFKEVNDTFGHAAGDGLLRAVADRLTLCVRDEDTVARLAGDEFVILLPHLAAPDDVVTVAARVLDALGEPFTVADERLLLAGSIGIALYPADGQSAQDLLAAADAAMYRAKETSGASFELFSADLATQALERLHTEARLLDALGSDELVLHYQPIVDLQTGRAVGAEALVRWNHPEQGFLLPGHFVPIAEQSDLIVMLGEKVVFDACRELRRWQDLGLHDQFVSVNVAARQFRHGLVSTVTAALRATGANPERLVVELTEGTVVDNISQVASALAELNDLGVTCAIDDFGTGYCGLRYLGTLPVTSLKIDRSFIQGMTPSAAAIVAATIAMGHSLGLTLVAEGVETPEQRRFLTEHGCDRIQGYLVGKPMPADELVDLLQIARLDADLTSAAV